MEDCSMSNGTPEISAIVVCFNTDPQLRLIVVLKLVIA